MSQTQDLFHIFCDRDLAAMLTAVVAAAYEREAAYIAWEAASNAAQAAVERLNEASAEDRRARDELTKAMQAKARHSLTGGGTTDERTP